MKTSSDADMDTRSNEPSEYSVSELSQKIKRHLEDGFDVVRVRGELGKVATPPSGHIYLSLKDDKAVLDGVIWRSNARALAFKPEIGLEVIATGQLRTYAPQSKYQISIDSIAPAGEGALMAMLEKRKRKLAAQGLFNEERKRELPFLPQIIGVATSPGGAVIHDILHRLSGRFPRHVLLWPVQVQGEKCAAEVVAAVRGFNALKHGGDIPRPDIIIVARGGGSLEDLWPFNEEEIVQAVAASDIPVISAIGHESDTTLIDLAADKRAPTPTAAAEFAVPVRSELLETVEDFARRLNLANTRRIETAAERLNQSARHIRRASDILSPLMQRFDNIEGRLKRAFAHGHAIQVERFASLGARISLHALRKQLDAAIDRFDTIKTRVNRSAHTMLSDLNKKLEAHGNLLEAFSHQRVLERGFALVWEGKNLVSRAEQARAGTEVSLEFAGNNRVQATIASESSAKPKKNPASKTTKEQESLFKKS
ncbi:MAG: exodeoxyribonuclease VII large subunit [Hyphomicrobiales bacterium]|nr:exodeoxyribonuclease VII large subunit [Hyphomicrobiales bacterium]